MTLNDTLKLLERAKKPETKDGVVDELAKYELWMAAEANKLTHHHTDKFFHPSSISKMCEKCLTFKFIKNPDTGKLYEPNKTTNPDSIRRMENGTYVHMRLQSDMMKAGLVKIQRYKKGEPDAEVEISIPKLRIIGHADGEFLTSGNPIWEIKSMNEREWIGLTRPKPEHRIQGTIYAHAKKRENCVFWYENKNTQKPKRFVVPYSKEVMIQVRDLCLGAIECIKKGVLGKRHRAASSKDIHCRWCEWSTYCWRMR